MTADYKIYIVENHDVVREVVRSFVSRIEGMTVCGDAASADRALAEIAEKSPDLVLVDLSLTGPSGIELIEKLRARHPEVACVVLTGHVEEVYRERAIRAGTDAYVLKDDPEELEATLRAVLAARAED